MGWIYVITGPSGKRYVGQTRQAALHRRLWKHCQPTSRCTLLRRAIRRHGGRYNAATKSIDNFRVAAWPVEDRHLNAMETRLIRELGTKAPTGYNTLATPKKRRRRRRRNVPAQV